MPTADFAARVESTMESVASSEEISDHNAELLEQYHRDRTLNGLSDATQQKNMAYLKKVGEYAGETPLEEFETDDVKAIVERIHNRDLSPSTVHTYKEVIRLFFTWLYDAEDGNDVEQVAWMDMNGSYTNDTLPKDLLTQEDIQKQIAAAKNDRDKALIALLYETGARIGELIDLTVGDVEDRNRGNKIVVNGKTGSRRIPLVECVPQLSDWLSKHPDPRKDAPLWCKIQQHGPEDRLDPSETEALEDVHGIGPAYAEQLREGGIETTDDLLETEVSELCEIVDVSEGVVRGWLEQFDPDFSPDGLESLDYNYIRLKILKPTMERAGIEKPSNPHHYRHSRASELANQMTEAQLCEWFGWVQGSDVPAKYVHLSGRDLDHAYDAMHGLVEPDEEDESTVQTCGRCEELNTPEAAFCQRCGFALDQETAAEVEEAEDSSTESAGPEQMELALKIARVMNEDPEAVDEFLERHE